MARRITIVAALFAIADCLRTPIYNSDKNGENSVTGLEFVSRMVVPYDGTNSAFGFGGAEQSAYDEDEHLVYLFSEAKAINVVDLETMEIVTYWETGASLTSGKVCGGKLFVAAAAAVKTNDGAVFIYETVKRGETSPPKLLSKVAVGPLPDMILPNKACTMLAVGNEGEARTDGATLIDPVGSVDLVEDLDAAAPTVTRVSFGGLAATDEELIEKEIDLLLSAKAMEYFDDHSAAFKDEIDWSAARAAYTVDTQLEPEYLAWSGDDKTVYVNCQENSAIVTVDAMTKEATGIHAMGHKLWDGAPNVIDTDNKDGDCVLLPKPGFATMRMPDSIAAAHIDGEDYIVFAEEGDDLSYGPFEDKQKFKDVIESATTFSEDFAEFVPGDGMADAFANFGDTKMRVSIGSAGVDYSDPAAPVYKGAVGYGGRGISIYKVTGEGLEWVWDSGSEFEKEVCAHYPWAYNGIQDEEFALNRAPGGFLYNSLPADDGLKETIDEMNDPEEDGCEDSGDGQPGACPLGGTVEERTLKDGPGTEAMTVGVACGRLLAATATEKSGVLMVYDISNPSAPALVAHAHASPASETKSPEIAFADGDLGDIDTESIIFVEAAASPSGKAGLLVAGAWSSTLSWWEFTCAEEPAPACPPSGWHKAGNAEKDCAWVAGKPDTRCGVKGPAWGQEKLRASYGCADACGRPCGDSASWHKKGADAMKKGCAWVSIHAPRCTVVGEDGTLASEACPAACMA